MATRNPYLSRLTKTIKESGNEQANERLKQLGENPSVDAVKIIYADFGIELPKMGAKQLTEEEKAQRAKEREEKKKREEILKKQAVESKYSALRDILENGTQEEVDALNEIIEKHQAVLKKEELKKEIAEKEKELAELTRQKEKELEELKKQLGE